MTHPLHHLAAEPSSQEALRACKASLRTPIDPDAVDRRARHRQGELLAGYAGREAALARGDLRFTPTPGTEAAFH